MNQLFLLNIDKPKPSGRTLRDKGMKQAIDHTQRLHKEWQKQALDFLYLTAQMYKEFSCEQVRKASEGFVPIPPSLRAWGAVFMAGAKKGWIRQIGYIHVDNPTAHMANAALWESLLWK